MYRCLELHLPLERGLVANHFGFTYDEDRDDSDQHQASHGDVGRWPGKEIGDILEYLMEKVLEEPSVNTKEKLESFALEYYKSEIDNSIDKGNHNENS